MKQRYRYAISAQAAFIGSAGLLVASWSTGCTSLPTNLVATNAVNIERSDSSRARIGSLYVGESNGQLKIRGRLKKRHAGRSAIPGHLHIEVLGENGAVLEEGVVRYYRHNAKSGVAYFSREFDVRPEDVRTVRVIHHVWDEDGVIDDGASQKPESMGRLSSVCCLPKAWPHRLLLSRESFIPWLRSVSVFVFPPFVGCGVRSSGSSVSQQHLERRPVSVRYYAKYNQ